MLEEDFQRENAQGQLGEQKEQVAGWTEQICKNNNKRYCLLYSYWPILQNINILQQLNEIILKTGKF